MFWQALGLDFREQAFDWSKESMPQDWQYVKGWHANVSASGGIKAASQTDEEKARAEFAGAAETAPQLLRYLDTHLPSYEALKARSLTSEG